MSAFHPFVSLEDNTNIPKDPSQFQLERKNKSESSQDT